MYYKLSATQENDLLKLPETGMGYQVIEATKSGSINRENFLVLNSEVVIEMNGNESDDDRKVIIEGNMAFKESAFVITLNSIFVFSKQTPY